MLVNPAVQRLGQQILAQLVQKAITKIIRELLASEEVPSSTDLPQAS
jgi:hypothetical protein